MKQQLWKHYQFSFHCRGIIEMFTISEEEEEEEERLFGKINVHYA